MLVLSGATEGRAETFEVASPLRWIGTFEEARPETPEIVLPAGDPGPATIAESGAPIRSPTSRGALLVVLTLVVVALLLLLWLL